MSSPRFRLRTLLIAVALIGIDLAAIVRAIDLRPRLMAGVGMAGLDTEFMSDGSRVIYDPRRPGSPPVAVVPAPWSSRLWRWGPVVVALGISLLAIGVAYLTRPWHPVEPDPPPPE
jgi:hypothetical protein